jgi:hypothetical protein
MILRETKLSKSLELGDLGNSVKLDCVIKVIKNDF